MANGIDEDSAKIYGRIINFARTFNSQNARDKAGGKARCTVVCAFSGMNIGDEWFKQKMEYRLAIDRFEDDIAKLNRGACKLVKFTTSRVASSNSIKKRTSDLNIKKCV